VIQTLGAIVLLFKPILKVKGLGRAKGAREVPFEC
jgi:hypothetical protein